MRILCIDKGGSRIYEHIFKLYPDQTHLVEIPEPTNGNNNAINKGILKIVKAIEEVEPTILVAGSRGGKIVAKLLASGKWKGRTLLFGAMATAEATQCTDCPLLIVHGTRDTLNPIERVRRNVEYSSATLEEIVDGGHSLAFSDSEMKRIIQRVNTINVKKVNQKHKPNPMFALLGQLKKT